MSLAVPLEKLRYTFDCSTIACTTTAELIQPTTIIGQPRGVKAIDFGIKMKSPGYNIFVLGETGTGRTTAIQRFVEERAALEPPPSDWIYVNNFEAPHKPIAIELPAGIGSRLRDALAECVDVIKSGLPGAFDSDSFRGEALNIQRKFEERQGERLQALGEKAAELGAVVGNTPEGWRILPARDGRPLSPEELAARTEEEQTRWKETVYTLQAELQDLSHDMRQLENEARTAMNQVMKRVANAVVQNALTILLDQFGEHPPIRAYLERVRQDIVEHVELFRPVPEHGKEDGDAVPEIWFRRYQVNLLIDHHASQGAPVLVEYNPSVPRLLGRVEHEGRFGGGSTTDFTLVRGGALHAANGGYLVLRAQDLFTEPGAWDGLKRSLIGQAVRPDDPAVRGGAAASSLDPQPIPLRIKVLIVGPPALYYYLYEMDEDFASVFKVMADFDAVVDRTSENEMAYARFIAAFCEEEKLCHLNAEAVGRVIEYGCRRAGTQRKLSARFGSIADLVREASYWAREDNREIVILDDVITAIENRIYMHNRIETRTREFLIEGKRLVATSGHVVGQINALSVGQIGEYIFGQASRVTVRTYVGKSGVVAIDREVALAGPIHNKGVMTLIGYLGGQYATDLPLSLSAQITFEQNYGGIDGDSAASTELYALLSSLSEMPINQAIAVTGSVNQLGQIQAIGGVTEKIEGWFEICRERGLTGEHGVIIPASNVDDLMLRDMVVEAVRDGRFHIWAVESVDQGIELLTGRPAADVHAAARKRLNHLAETMLRYER